MDSSLPFPVVQSRSSGANNTDTTTHVMTMPSGVVAGDMILVFFACDGAPVITASDASWHRVIEIHDGSLETGSVFYKIATGGDALTLTTSVSEQSTHLCWRISGAGTVSGRFGFSTTAYEQHYDNDWTINSLYIAATVYDGIGSASAAPASFTNLRNVTAANSTGASSWAAERNIRADADSGIPTGSFTASAGNGLTFILSVSPNPPERSYSPRVLHREPSIIDSTTSHSIRIPGSVRRGEGLVAFCSFAAGVTLTIGGASNWQIIGQDSVNNITGIVLWKIADDNNTLTITTSAACTSTSNTYRVSNVLKVIGGIRRNDPNVAINFNLDAPYTGAPFVDVNLHMGYFFTERQNTFYRNSVNGIPVAKFGHGPSLYVQDYTFTPRNLNYGTRGAVDAVSHTLSGELIVIPKKDIYPYDVGYIRETITEPTANTTINFSTKVDSTFGFTGSEVIYEDIAIAQYSVSTVGRNPTLTIPGYTTISEQYAPGGVYNTKTILAYKFMGTTPDTEITVSGTGNAADHGLLQVWFFRDVDPVNPIEGLQTAVGTGDTRPLSPPTSTYPLQGSLIIQTSAGSKAPGAVADVAPNFNTFRLSFGVTSGSSSSLRAVHSYFRSLNQDFLPGTWTGGDASADNTWALIQFALRPVGVPKNRSNTASDSAAAKIRYWDGTAWVRGLNQQNYNNLKYWDGTRWVKKPYSVWDGTKWI